MATILSANASSVLLDNEPIEGLQEITYKVNKSRQDVPALGTDERISVDFGLKIVTGTLKVKSDNPTLDTHLADNTAFQIVANLKKGEALRTVSFDECYLDDKSFELGANDVASTAYTFTATRVREE